MVYGYSTGILFSRKLEMATEMKLLKLGTVCLDGTKIHANASRHSALSHGHIVKLEARQKETGEKSGGRPPAEPEPGVKQSDQINLMDEKSRIMKVSGGDFEQCYNAQAGVDAATMLVGGHHLDASAQ